ncbi:MAG TPA: sigma 54-interacting transcriptional regulator [Gemmatimonadaceae bacterium]|nr:sigma 54-interacting transcriptional regulator [Gemmatimonadaceae bacterium]
MPDFPSDDTSRSNGPLAPTNGRDGAARATNPSPPRIVPALGASFPSASSTDGASRQGTPLGLESIVGSSPTLGDALDRARKVAGSRLTTVLIVGETGTGKELFARGIHYAGPTRGEPFVAVNCAAIPETLLESELFGHERGAFTDARAQKRGLMELASTGTLFLDEIGEMPPRLQPKLLRALEERRVRRLGGLQEIEISCRIIAAANMALHDAVTRLEFREDLYYRLNVFRIALPPLREREGDVELLARHFLIDLARQQQLEPKTLEADAVAALRAHTWPGNIRELKNVIEHAAILSDGSAIHAEHLMIQQRTMLPATRASGPVREIRIPPEGKALDAIEKEAVQMTLQITRGNRSAASRILGISRPTLARKMREYGIHHPPGAAGE